MSENKICPNCGAMNNAASGFCRQCGADLKDVNIMSDEYNINSFSNADNEGVSFSDIAIYTGKKEQKVESKYSKYFNGSIVGFNPLVFLLSLLINPIVAAFWFLHKKVYSIAILMMAVGLIFMSGTAVLSVATLRDFNKQAVEYLDENIDVDDFDFFFNADKYADDNGYEIVNEKVMIPLDDAIDELKDMAEEHKRPLVRIAKESFNERLVYWILLAVLNIAISLVFALFANYFCFKNAVNKIIRVKKTKIDYTADDIAKAGGVSCRVWPILLFVYNLILLCMPVLILVLSFQNLNF